ncbi:MAG TPA: asparagine synthase (glutamine-hydrolyzing), partial [Candidatus Methylacidiphilales bacterium]|nr:asparagine synthase (glutamine-hydrolyzing) [Candidatus Methylacidiphilales bacterium]
YTITSQGIAFASEIKSLLALPEVAARPNYRILDGYLGVGYCPGLETCFDGIDRLPPAGYLQVRDGVVTQAAYWDLAYEQCEDLGEAAYCQQIRDLLEDSVRLQLRSDVPLGVFLSGGVDSSAVVATMRRLGAEKIKTFSVGWDYGPEYDEGRYARQVAAQFRTDHYEHRVTPQEFLDLLPDYVWHMDEPVQEAASIPLLALAKKARQEVTVILSGEGADEVFGGYPVYRYMNWLERYRALPRYARRPVNALLSRCGPKWSKHARLSELSLERRYFSVVVNDLAKIRALYTPRLASQTQGNSIEQLVAPYYDRTVGQDAQRRMQYLDVKSWLVDDLLIKADRMSMAASLELRVPFLDHRFLELAGRIPSKYRLKHGQTKYLLKKAVEPDLPRKIIYRRKQGFPTPVGILFRGPLQNYVRETLLSERCFDRGLFQPAAVRRLVDEHAQGAADHHKALWQLLILEMWHRVFVERDSLHEMKNAGYALVT